MKILVLMDSFKGSLTSEQAGEAIREGILSADDSVVVSVYPFADGGEGTLEAFLKADKNSRKIKVNVSDPLGRKHEAYYGVLSDGTVIIETAQAAGLCLLTDVERNPLHTTTRGIGELIKHAIESGHRDFIVALGGSATNDCGTGMLKELGFGIYDENNDLIEDGALGLSRAVSVSSKNKIPQLNECRFTIACDVKNPLFGENGASYIFAPQKGASCEDLEKMDRWMRDFSDLVKYEYPVADPYAEGSGAAGGLGFAFKVFLGGKMKPGADVLLARTGIENEISSSDLVITGEGCIDGQTYMGKAPVRIAAFAKRYYKPVIAVAGCVKPGAEKCHEAGIDVILPVVPAPMSIEDAMEYETARENIKRTAGEMIRMMKIWNQ